MKIKYKGMELNPDHIRIERYNNITQKEEVLTLSECEKDIWNAAFDCGHMRGYNMGVAEVGTIICGPTAI